jgi:hypothetical protein
MKKLNNHANFWDAASVIIKGLLKPGMNTKTVPKIRLGFQSSCSNNFHITTSGFRNLFLLVLATSNTLI